ncbi:hypothetical protein HOG98_05755 [bacterium]|jgi:hypothetical protein|nr:hypothetical protein [bacterium]
MYKIVSVNVEDSFFYLKTNIIKRLEKSKRKKIRLRKLVETPLQKNIRIGQKIIEEVNKKLRASNRVANKKINKEAFEKAQKDISTYIREIKNIPYLLDSDIKVHIRTVKEVIALKYGIGNCGAMAELGLSFLEKKNINDAVLVTFQDPEAKKTDHSFILLGVGFGDFSDYTSFPSDAVIIDPWSKLCMPVSQLPQFSALLPTYSAESIQLKTEYPSALLKIDNTADFLKSLNIKILNKKDHKKLRNLFEKAQRRRFYQPVIFPFKFR